MARPKNVEGSSNLVEFGDPDLTKHTITSPTHPTCCTARCRCILLFFSFMRAAILKAERGREGVEVSPYVEGGAYCWGGDTGEWC